jgi:hypothetical protein
LTYNFTRLARCWPSHVAVASESPRRNRCFHSSIDKVVRHPKVPSAVFGFVAWAPAGRPEGRSGDAT